MQAQRVLVGPESEVVLVCMSVRYGFTIEIYGFMHSLRTFWHVPLRMPLRDGSGHQDGVQGLGR